MPGRKEPTAAPRVLIRRRSPSPDSSRPAGRESRQRRSVRSSRLVELVAYVKPSRVRVTRADRQRSNSAKTILIASPATSAPGCSTTQIDNSVELLPRYSPAENSFTASRHLSKAARSAGSATTARATSEAPANVSRSSRACPTPAGSVPPVPSADGQAGFHAAKYVSVRP